MADRAATARLIAAAARRHLRPLGLHRKGRSRLWYDDRGWSLIVVEFQTSGNDGTYLNIAAMWLWDEFEHWTLDDGDRISWRDDGSFLPEPHDELGWEGFLSVITPDQFARDIDTVAGVAARRVEQLRSEFPDPAGTAARLAGRPTRPGEDAGWHTYHTGAAAALAGDADAARQAFHRIAATTATFEWEIVRARTATELAALADDPSALRQRIVELIEKRRRVLGLPPTA